MKKIKGVMISLILAVILAVSGSFSALPAWAADAGEEITIRTTLSQGMTIRNSKKLFDVRATDSSGNKLDTAVTINGKAVTMAWNDTEKTSYTLNFTDMSSGTYTVLIKASKGETTKTEAYRIIYDKASPGEFLGYASVSVDAFTISQGYLIEPELVPVYEGEPASVVITELIREHGYDYTYTGSVDSGFYLSAITGSNYQRDNKAEKELELSGVILEPTLAEALPEIAEAFRPDSYTEGRLGEFDFTTGSGWMYCVNGTFPNVGFADYYLSEGDVMRVQFTTALGRDIGGSDSTGAADGSEVRPADRDALTAAMARLCSAPNCEALKATQAVSDAFENALYTAADLGASQETVDEAAETLSVLISEGKVTSLILDRSEMALENLSSGILSASVETTGTFAPQIEWYSSDLSVAKVKNGKVTAVSAGIAEIRAVCGELEAVCKVTVPEILLSSISFSEENVEIALGKTKTVSVKLTPANTTETVSLTYESSDDQVAAVNADGRITATGVGEAVITARTGEHAACLKVTVPEIPLEGISFTKDSLNMLRGTEQKLTVVYEPAGTTEDRSVTYESADPGVAGVSAEGVVKAVAIGSTTVRAVCGGHEAEIPVTVTEIPMESVKLNYRTSSVTVGKNLYLVKTELPADTTDAKAGTWSSSDEKIASVDKNGKVTGVSEGIATIRFTNTENGMSAECPVRVVTETAHHTAGITLGKTELGMTVGEKKALDAVCTNTLGEDSTDPVSLLSSDETVVKAADGTLEALKNGTAEITVYSGAESAVCTVTVKEAPAESKPVKKKAVVTASDRTAEYSASAKKYSINAKVTSGAKLSYVSNNSKIKVSSTGVITMPAKFVGKAVITISAAETADYKAATTKITVTVNPKTTVLTSVKNISSKKIVVKWKKNSAVTGYRLQYSQNKDFKNGNKTVSVSKNKTLTKTIKSLKKGKTYYVRICTYKMVGSTKYCSKWSAVKKVKIAK